MSNGHAVYKNAEGKELHLHLDVDLKSESIREFYTAGDLRDLYAEETEQLKSLVLNRTLKEARALKREKLNHQYRLTDGGLPLASLSQWLLHSAIDDYLGTAATLKEQNDLLCLCFGVGVRELKKQILTRSDYDLPQLLQETLATSACGSCKEIILQTMKDIREEYGKILGLEHSQSRIDKAGHWIKIKGLYPADLLIRLDELKKSWMQREALVGLFAIEITLIEGHHLWLSVAHLDSGLNEVETHRAEAILQALADYWRSEMGALFFVHLAS